MSGLKNTRNSMHYLRMKLNNASLVLLLAGSSAAAQTLEDQHLQVVPRTPPETERIENVVALTNNFTTAETFEALPGGATSVRLRDTRDAFSQPSANMDFDSELDFKVGNGLFKKLWVSAPASTIASDGLGHIF